MKIIRNIQNDRFADVAFSIFGCAVMALSGVASADPLARALQSTSMNSDLPAAPAVPFKYSTSGGKITITRYTGSGGAVEIPSRIEGLPVYIIGKNAFLKSNVTSVTIPDGVTGIEEAAFGLCSKLKTVKMPASVTSIGNSAFSACSELTGVKIPKKVNSIGDFAFYECSSLKSVAIPVGVTSIGVATFTNCSSLTKLTIPESVASIGMNAFTNCTNLKSVKIPAKVVSLGDYSFAGCKSITSVEIPSKVARIGDGAFSGCDNLTGVIFMGNAPKTGGIVFDYAASSFIVYYHPSKSGFTSPRWRGYSAKPLVPTADIAVHQGAAETNSLKDNKSSRDFGGVKIGRSSFPMVFTIKNEGMKPLNNLNVMLSGEQAKVFKLIQKPAKSLAKGESTQFKVVFTPKEEEPVRITLHITSNDADENPFRVKLAGYGTKGTIMQ